MLCHSIKGPRASSAQERQRFYIMESLRTELLEASEELGYQRDRARHHEVSPSTGFALLSAPYERYDIPEDVYYIYDDDVPYILYCIDMV